VQKLRRLTVAGVLAAPRKSALQALIGNIQASTWETIQQQLLQCAQQRQVETGRKIRIDSTVTETHIKAPLDSQLLWDAVRVMVRLLKLAEALDDTVRRTWRNHFRNEKGSGQYRVVVAF